LELIKPVVQTFAQGDSTEPVVLSEAAAGRRHCAQATLYTVLEQFLRLTHPLMPFVTEELWQRLPGIQKVTDKPSIMVSAYPSEVPQWTHVEAEADMEVVKEAIHAARSLRADYRIANPVKGEFYFRTDSPQILAALTNQADDFCTLARAVCLTPLVSNAETPPGCCLRVLSQMSLTVFLNLTGIVNVEQELTRLGKEADRLIPLIDQMRRKTQAPGYEDKVPEDVRAANAEKLAACEAELVTTQEAIAAFQAMK